jgi:uncharacterized protein (DUF2252 family)
MLLNNGHKYFHPNYNNMYYNIILHAFVNQIRSESHQNKRSTRNANEMRNWKMPRHRIKNEGTDQLQAQQFNLDVLAHMCHIPDIQETNQNSQTFYTVSKNRNINRNLKLGH